MANRWIQRATARMKRRGTIGAFGKATKKKIAAGLKRGGLAAKRANFAKNMAKISRRAAARKRARRLVRKTTARRTARRR